MAVKIPVTHGWNGLIQFLKLCSILVQVFLIMIFLVFLSEIFDISDIILIIFFILALIGLFVIGHYRLWAYFDYLDTLSTYLYVRISLKTPIDLKEAKAIKYFFEPNQSGKWYPMTHLRKLPKEMRKIALFESVGQLSEDHFRKLRGD